MARVKAMRVAVAFSSDMVGGIACSTDDLDKEEKVAIIFVGIDRRGIVVSKKE
jgi:hypothetical protein